MADGSSIINVASSGLPNETQDYAYAFCIGTQIFQNPDQDPRNGSLSFKVDPELFDVGISGDTVGTTAIGLATADNISSISSWSSTEEISDDGQSYGVYCVSFAENNLVSNKINICCAGSTIGFIQKNRQSTSTDIGFDTLTISGHGYSNGDAVVIYSGSPPSPLQLNTKYYVTTSGEDKIRLASSHNQSLIGDVIDITISGGPVYLRSDDLIAIRRNGISEDVGVYRNNVEIYAIGSNGQTLRPFFWTRESSNSATIPVFKEIKVSGAS